MVEIRYVQMNDKAFWYRFDKHLPEREFENKVNIQGYEQPMELFLSKSI